MSYPRMANPPEEKSEAADTECLASQLLGVLLHLNADIIAFKPNGRTAYCSEHLVHLLGLTPENSAEFLGAVAPSEVTREQVRKAVSNSETTKTELEIYLQERPLKLTVTTLAGKPPLRTVIVQDQSHERKQRKHLERLERLATVGQITAGAAHEFNNNLTSVLGWTQIAMQNTPAESPAASALDIIEDNAQKAKKIFSKLLEMSRSQTGGTERALVSPEDVLNDALGVLSFELQNANIDIVRRFEATHQVYLDADGLGQVFVNIVRNAIDAMPDGGRLLVSIGIDKSNIRIAFADNGPGMTDDVAQRVFESFFTTKRDSEIPLHGGTGLGLSISRDIVNRMGGDIAVDSTPGRGTTFTITIPHTVPAPATSRTPYVSRPTIPPGAIVLVVDDEPDIGEMIRTSLELQGVSVIAVSNGDDAVGQLGRIPFDAAFVDYTMPGLSGHELGIEMQKAQPNLPVVFMSGLNVETDHIIGDFIKKPFDLDDIQKKLYEVMKRKKEALINRTRH